MKKILIALCIIATFNVSIQAMEAEKQDDEMQVDMEVDKVLAPAIEQLKEKKRAESFKQKITKNLLNGEIRLKKLVKKYAKLNKQVLMRVNAENGKRILKASKELGAAIDKTALALDSFDTALEPENAIPDNYDADAMSVF